MQTIITRQPPSFRSLILALIVCFVAIFVNWRFPQVIQPVRDVLKVGYYPIYAFANYPVLSKEWMKLQVQSEQSLRRENIALRAELDQAKVRLQKLSELSAENTRLRGLVDTPLIIDGRMLITEIIGVDPNPLNHIIIINKGSSDQLQEGQTVLDDQGIMGQIIAVYPHSARVMLLSDKESALSVRLDRTGMRSIVSGKGDYSELVMQYVPSSADIKVGDLVYSSGLGERYPAGYLVGRVKDIEVPSSSEFADITIQPTAQLSSGHNVVVLFSQALSKEQPNGTR